MYGKRNDVLTDSLYAVLAGYVAYSQVNEALTLAFDSME